MKFWKNRIMVLTISSIMLLLMISCSNQTPDITVVFDGEDCVATGPTEFPPGKVTTQFIDSSGIGGELWIVYLQPGKTFQDHKDLHEPGVHVNKPEWASYAFRIDKESKEAQGTRTDTETWDLDQVGDHAILCYVPMPLMLWTAAPVRISESN